MALIDLLTRTLYSSILWFSLCTTNRCLFMFLKDTIDIRISIGFEPTIDTKLTTICGGQNHLSICPLNLVIVCLCTDGVRNWFCCMCTWINNNNRWLVLWFLISMMSELKIPCWKHWQVTIFLKRQSDIKDHNLF